MPKLIELIDQKSYDRAAEVAQDLLLQLLEAPGILPHGERRPTFRSHTPLEVGMPLLEAIHYWLWAHSEPSGRTDYPRVWRGNLRDAISKITGGILNDRDLITFTYSALQQLYHMRVIARTSKRSRTVYLRPWAERRRLSEFSAGRFYNVIDEREEKRIEEFADAPVRTMYQLPDVPLPQNPTLADLVAWAREVKEKWTAAFNRVNRAYQDELEHVKELEAQIERLKPLAADAEQRQQLEALTDIWSSN